MNTNVDFNNDFVFFKKLKNECPADCQAEPVEKLSDAAPPPTTLRSAHISTNLYYVLYVNISRGP